MRRKLHERIGNMLKPEVDANIALSGINDSSGKIRNWQENFGWQPAADM